MRMVTSSVIMNQDENCTRILHQSRNMSNKVMVITTPNTRSSTIQKIPRFLHAVFFDNFFLHVVDTSPKGKYDITNKTIQFCIL